MSSSEAAILDTSKKTQADDTISTKNNESPILIENTVVEKKDGMAIPEKIIKKFEVATALTNTLDNISEEEVKIFNKLEKKVNKNDILYSQFENSIIQKIEKVYKEK